MRVTLSLQITSESDRQALNFDNVHVTVQKTHARKAVRKTWAPNRKTATMALFTVGEKPLVSQSSIREIIEKEKLLCIFISFAVLSSTVSKNKITTLYLVCVYAVSGSLSPLIREVFSWYSDFPFTSKNKTSIFQVKLYETYGHV